MIIYLYTLKFNTKIVYVGLTKSPKQRKWTHARNWPDHEFNIIGEFTDINDARKAEIENITEHDTFVSGWNKSRGGDYLTGSSDRRGIGGVKKGTVPWNKGLSKDDPRVRVNVERGAETRRAMGLYEKTKHHLKAMPGNLNPMKRKDVREQYSKRVTGRKRKYREDGTWFWYYPLEDISSKS